MLVVNFIKPVMYPQWVSNIVIVPKKNGKIKVYVDFTNLNKACPMHPYTLSRIPNLVDATDGCRRLSTLYAYDQIPQHEADQEHIAFITNHGLTMTQPCHSNSRTKERLTKNWLTRFSKIGKKVEAYIDDMVVKSERSTNQNQGLQDVFVGMECG